MKRYRVKIERLDQPTTADDLRDDREFIVDQIADNLAELRGNQDRGALTLVLQDVEARAQDAYRRIAALEQD